MLVGTPQWTWAATPACISVRSPTTTQEPSLTGEQTHNILVGIKIVKSKSTPKGITSPCRLDLSDGDYTHDTVCQSIDEHRVRIDIVKRSINLLPRGSYHCHATRQPNALARVVEPDAVLRLAEHVRYPRTNSTLI